MKKFAALAMAGAIMTTSLAGSAFATDVQVDPTSKQGTTKVVVSAEGATFDVTVPTVITVHVDAAGNTTCADNLAITNNSAANVRVAKIEMQDGAWELVDYNGGDRSAIADKVDAKKLGFALTANSDTAATSGASTGTPKSQVLSHTPASWEIGTGSSNTLPMTAAAIATTVSAAISDAEQAATVVFTIEWAK